MEFRPSKTSACLLIILSTTVFFTGVIVNPTIVNAQSTDQTNQSLQSQNASVTIDVNNSTQEEIELKTVTLPENGFLVVQNSSQLVSSAGVIDHTVFVRHGTFTDVVVDFDEPVPENQTVWVTIHNDTNGNREFDFEENQSLDGPYRQDGEVISDSAQVGADTTETQPRTSSTTAADAETATSTATPASEQTELPTSPSAEHTETSTQNTSPERAASSGGSLSTTDGSHVGAGGDRSGSGIPAFPLLLLPVLLIACGGGYLLLQRRANSGPAPHSGDDNANVIQGSPQAVTLESESESDGKHSASEKSISFLERLRGRMKMVFDSHTIDLRAYGLTQRPKDDLVFDLEQEMTHVQDLIQRIHELQQLPIEIEDEKLESDQHVPQEGTVYIRTEDVQSVEQRAKNDIALAQETILLLKEVLQAYSTD